MATSEDAETGALPLTTTPPPHTQAHLLSPSLSPQHPPPAVHLKRARAHTHTHTHTHMHAYTLHTHTLTLSSLREEKRLRPLGPVACGLALEAEAAELRASLVPQAQMLHFCRESGVRVTKGERSEKRREYGPERKRQKHTEREDGGKPGGGERETKEGNEGRTRSKISGFHIPFAAPRFAAPAALTPASPPETGIAPPLLPQDDEEPTPPKAALPPPPPPNPPPAADTLAPALCPNALGAPTPAAADPKRLDAAPAPNGAAFGAFSPAAPSPSPVPPAPPAPNPLAVCAAPKGCMLPSPCIPCRPVAVPARFAGFAGFAEFVGLLSKAAWRWAVSCNRRSRVEA